jgi:hypothetical protein
MPTSTISPKINATVSTNPRIAEIQHNEVCGNNMPSDLCLMVVFWCDYKGWPFHSLSKWILVSPL